MDLAPGTVAYCESAVNPALGRWHLRIIGPDGLHPGGGVTEPACGATWHNGWDLHAVPDHEITSPPPFVCPRCVAALTQETST